MRLRFRGLCANGRSATEVSAAQLPIPVVDPGRPVYPPLKGGGQQDEPTIFNILGQSMAQETTLGRNSALRFLQSHEPLFRGVDDGLDMGNLSAQAPPEVHISLLEAAYLSPLPLSACVVAVDPPGGLPIREAFHLLHLWGGSCKLPFPHRDLSVDDIWRPPRSSTYYPISYNPKSQSLSLLLSSLGGSNLGTLDGSTGQSRTGNRPLEDGTGSLASLSSDAAERGAEPLLLDLDDEVSRTMERVLGKGWGGGSNNDSTMSRIDEGGSCDGNGAATVRGGSENDDLLWRIRCRRRLSACMTLIAACDLQPLAKRKRVRGLDVYMTTLGFRLSTPVVTQPKRVSLVPRHRHSAMEHGWSSGDFGSEVTPWQLGMHWAGESEAWGGEREAGVGGAVLGCLARGAGGLEGHDRKIGQSSLNVELCAETTRLVFARKINPITHGLHRTHVTWPPRIEANDEGSFLPTEGCQAAGKSVMWAFRDLVKEIPIVATSTTSGRLRPRVIEDTGPWRNSALRGSSNGLPAPIILRERHRWGSWVVEGTGQMLYQRAGREGVECPSSKPLWRAVAQAVTPTNPAGDKRGLRTVASLLVRPPDSTGRGHVLPRPTRSTSLQKSMSLAEVGKGSEVTTRNDADEAGSYGASSSDYLMKEIAGELRSKNTPKTRLTPADTAPTPAEVDKLEPTAQLYDAVSSSLKPHGQEQPINADSPSAPMLGTIVEDHGTASAPGSTPTLVSDSSRAVNLTPGNLFDQSTCPVPEPDPEPSPGQALGYQPSKEVATGAKRVLRTINKSTLPKRPKKGSEDLICSEKSKSSLLAKVSAEGWLTPRNGRTIFGPKPEQVDEPQPKSSALVPHVESPNADYHNTVADGEESQLRYPETGVGEEGNLSVIHLAKGTAGRRGKSGLGRAHGAERQEEGKSTRRERPGTESERQQGDEQAGNGEGAASRTSKVYSSARANEDVSATAMGMTGGAGSAEPWERRGKVSRGGRGGVGRCTTPLEGEEDVAMAGCATDRQRVLLQNIRRGPVESAFLLSQGQQPGSQPDTSFGHTKHGQFQARRKYFALIGRGGGKGSGRLGSVEGSTNKLSAVAISQDTRPDPDPVVVVSEDFLARSGETILALRAGGGARSCGGVAGSCAEQSLPSRGVGAAGCRVLEMEVQSPVDIIVESRAAVVVLDHRQSTGSGDMGGANAAGGGEPASREAAAVAAVKEKLRILTFQILKYSTIWLVLLMDRSPSTCGAAFNRLEQWLVGFPCRISIRYSYSEAHLAELIEHTARVELESRTTVNWRHGRRSPLDAAEKHYRDKPEWAETHYRHVRFLQLFPTMNPFSSSALLSLVPLKHLIVASYEELASTLLGNVGSSGGSGAFGDSGRSGVGVAGRVGVTAQALRGFCDLIRFGECNPV